MENFDKNIIVLGLILVSTFYLFYRSLFNTKKLTTFQQQNRWCKISDNVSTCFTFMFPFFQTSFKSVKL